MDTKMWNEQDEFEEQLATYWEHEDDVDALHLTSEKYIGGSIRKQPAARGKRVFRKVREGVAMFFHSHGKHTA